MSLAHDGDLMGFDSGGVLPTATKPLGLSTPQLWSMKNKYFSADLQLTFCPYSSEIVNFEDFEGIILVHSTHVWCN